MGLASKGDRQLAQLFDVFPKAAHDKLAARMVLIVDRLTARIQSQAPFKTGELRREIIGREFSDQPDRIAGRVEVYAPGVPGAYAKAATLEYGTDKPRRVFDRTDSLIARATGRNKRLVQRVSKPVHIRAFRYLRNPIEEMREEIDAELSAAVAEAANENAT